MSSASPGDATALVRARSCSAHPIHGRSVTALGASTGYLLRDALAQALLLLGAASTIGILIGYYLGTFIVERTDIPYVIEINAMMISGGLIVGGGLVGAVLAGRAIARIDQLIALVQLR